MYEVSAKFSISSAHYLNNYEGKCKRLHGHNWKVTVYLKGEELDPLGMLVDFTVLKGFFKTIEAQLDHNCLNEIEFFKQKNPTAENISEFIYTSMEELLGQSGIDNARVDRVSVYETENCEAVFYR